MRGCRAPPPNPPLLPKLSSDMPEGLERRLTPPWQVLHEMGEGLWACGSSLGVPGNGSIQHAEVRGQGSKHGSLLNVALPREALLQAGSWALLTTSYGRLGWFPFADGETETQSNSRLTCSNSTAGRGRVGTPLPAQQSRECTVKMAGSGLSCPYLNPTASPASQPPASASSLL